jgi:hypothetical protein
MTPHNHRRQTIHIWLVGLIITIAILAASCRPQKGCYGTRGMSGYSHCPSIQELRKDKKTAYLYCINTGIVGVWDTNGKLRSIYHVSK